MNANYKSIILAISLLLALPVLIFAAAGDLDLSFGNGGKVITPIGSSYDFAHSIAIQTDGKIVAAGYSQGVNADLRTADFAVVRYNTDGSLDTSFGGTGKIIIPIGGFADYANSVAIQARDFHKALDLDASARRPRSRIKTWHRAFPAK